MKLKTFVKRLLLMALTLFIVQSCDSNESSFGTDFQGEIVPTSLSYTDILNSREYGYIQTATPFVNSNGHPVVYEVLYVKQEGNILDASYLEKVTIKAPDTTYLVHKDPEVDLVIETIDISKAGQVTIAEENLFGYGDYYFTMSASISINGVMESTIFEDALRLNVGPGLVDAISYCPAKINYVNGESTVSDEPSVFGGNDDFRYELETEIDKLVIDEITGVVSVNPVYVVSETEFVSPIINVVSNISEEILAFEDVFTAVLSTESVILDKETDYFFYPPLKPKADKNTPLGGVGYSVDMANYASAAGWIKKVYYSANKGANLLTFPEVIAKRNTANVIGITGLNVSFFGPYKDPFETWCIADAVNLSLYAGCFNSKVEFWVKQSIPQNVIDDAGLDLSPIAFDVQITNNYTGDLITTEWTQVNELLTCKIGENGEDFTGTPYPLSGTIEESPSDASGIWVRCEMDLSNYKDVSEFTIAFRTKSNYETPLSIPLRGNVNISDLHFVAIEK
tara:strand:- start:31811 stop:33340 length:1530 start_codon:yes stop_codon:yes gene_type:complete